MQKPGISVIINAYHESPCLRQNIAELNSQKTSFPYEIIVVGRDMFFYSNCININSDCKSANARKSLGVRSARYDILVFMDDDCVAPDNYLQNIWNFYLSNPQTSILAGFYSQPPGTSYFKKAYNSLCNLWILKTLTTNKTCNHFLGGNFSCRKSVFPSFQSFPEDPDWGGEENRLISYIKKENLEISFSESFSADHHPDDNLLFFIKRAFLHGSNKSPGLRNHHPRDYSLFVKHFSFSYLPVYVLHLAIMFLGRLVRRKKSRKIVNILANSPKP